jgi:hypothetical protein
MFLLTWCSFLPKYHFDVPRTLGFCVLLLPSNPEIVFVDSRLKDEMELIHVVECEFAEECDREVPDWSNTLEMLFRKGVRAYRQNAKRG